MKFDGNPPEPLGLKQEANTPSNNNTHTHTHTHTQKMEEETLRKDIHKRQLNSAMARVQNRGLAYYGSR